MIMKLFRICLAAEILTAGTLLSPWSMRAEDSRPNEKIRTTKEIFADLRRAWLKADATSLMEYIGDAKVILSFEDEGIESGLYSRNQTYYLLEELFKKTKTTAFTFTKIIDEQKRGDNPHAFADRTYTRIEDEGLRQDQIYISLSKVNHQWFITHLMSLEKPKGQQPNNDSQQKR